MTLRGWTLTIPGGTELHTESCCNCGVVFAIPVDLYQQRTRDGRSFYCPVGHQQHYTAEKNAQDRLKAAEAAATAARDQMAAAVRDAEHLRVTLLRDRARFAKGVCPCCNRYFRQVHDHMVAKHPEYDVARLAAAPVYRCSCGRDFTSLRGLRTHQGHVRPDDWEKLSRKDNGWDKKRAHTTVVPA